MIGYSKYLKIIMSESYFSNMISSNNRIIRFGFLFTLKISLAVSYYKVRDHFMLCK